jgi:hypothetical protein
MFAGPRWCLTHREPPRYGSDRLERALRGEPVMAWKLEGPYFENCNCDRVCPCSVTSLVSPATQERCQVILIKGGPMAGLAPLVGKVLGVERATMEYSDQALRHSVRIGDQISIEIEDFVPPGLGGDTPTRLAGVFHPSNTTLTIAKPVSSQISAFGMEFHNEGRSAFSAPFAWQG